MDFECVRNSILKICSANGETNGSCKSCPFNDKGDCGADILTGFDTKRIEEICRTYCSKAPDGYLTIKDFAKKHGVSKQTVGGWARSRRIEGVLKIGINYYIPIDAERPDTMLRGGADGFKVANREAQHKDGYFTIKELIEKLKKPRSTINYYISEEKIHAEKIDGVWYIPEEELSKIKFSGRGNHRNYIPERDGENLLTVQEYCSREHIAVPTGYQRVRRGKVDWEYRENRIMIRA